MLHYDMENYEQARDTTGQAEHCSYAVLRVRKALQDASDAQMELAKARKELLIKRGRVRTSSRKVQLKRVDAGDTEATFMNQLRVYVNEYREHMPITLIDAYDRVEQTRDDLGEMEENYLQTERDLTGSEWKFMDQENEFYQFEIQKLISEEWNENLVPSGIDQLPTSPPLPPPPPPPLQHLGFPIDSTIPHPPPPQTPSQNVLLPQDPAQSGITDRNYPTVIAEVDSLRKHFQDLRQEQSQRIDEGYAGEIPTDAESPVVYELSPFAANYCSVLDQLSRCEVEAQQLKMEDMRQRFNASTLARRFSDPTDFFEHAPTLSEPMKRAHTESAVPIMSEDPTTKNHIRKWLLTYLRENVVEKALYLNILEDYGVPDARDGTWEDRATQYWSHDSSSDSEDKSQGYFSATRGASLRPNMDDDFKASVQCPSGTSSLKEILRVEHHGKDNDKGGFESYETSSDGYPDRPSKIPLPPSPSPSEHFESAQNLGARVPILRLTTSNELEQEGQSDTGYPFCGHQVTGQQNPLHPTTYIETAPRKDSCQSSDGFQRDESKGKGSECDQPHVGYLTNIEYSLGRSLPLTIEPDRHEEKGGTTIMESECSNMKRSRSLATIDSVVNDTDRPTIPDRNSPLRTPSRRHSYHATYHGCRVSASKASLPHDLHPSTTN